jgi:hypothetical protein
MHEIHGIHGIHAFILHALYKCLQNLKKRKQTNVVAITRASVGGEALAACFVPPVPPLVARLTNSWEKDSTDLIRQSKLRKL